MRVLNLSLFGRFQAELAGDPLSGFRTTKVQALLIFLAAETATPHRRETLTTLLWPGMPERSARQNLRQIMYNLRRAIPDLASQEMANEQNGETPDLSNVEGAVPLLLANRQTIQLNPQAAVDSDINQFEALIRSTHSHDHLDMFLCHDCQQKLATAVSLYTGDFLADFYLDDSNPFEEWAEVTRQTYRRQVLDALETLTSIKTRQTAYAEARVYAERQLEIDNLRESGYRQLMKILALSGQRGEGLALYDTCRRLLAEALGMAPATRTSEIYEQIRVGSLSFETQPVQGVRGFELKEKIGEGAYGTIHRALQPAVGREVAVKVIRRKYADDPDFIRRFEAEAQTIARLEHPYIVPLYDYWREPEGAFLVMRLLRGGNLLTSLESGPWEVEPTLKMLDQISSALSAAHRQGIVHRDIKPANILFDEAGNAYLSDFGIAKQTTNNLQLTADNAILGTPDYVSPEQLRNEPIGPPTDLYSLGAVLYEMLTGERPFPNIPVALLIKKQLEEPIPLISASRPDLPGQIDIVLERATAKQPTDRYPTALAMAEAFRLAAQGLGEGEANLRETAVGSGSRQAITPIAEISNPYKGLRAFQEADATDFYGRETVVEQLVASLSESRFLAVVGPSGSGKSSLVKAGLIPALRQEAIPGSDHWFVAEMVPGTHPLEELELALLPIAVNPPPDLVEPMQKDVRGMLRTMRRILPNEENAQLLLVIDQFEELFTLVEDDSRRLHFLNSLLAALNAPRSPLRLVVTLRADFYDRPLQIQPIAHLFKQHTEIVLPLNQEELTWAIREPARKVGVRMEESVVTAMVTDVIDQPGALPLLQYALTELFDGRQDNVMTFSAYHALGGVSGALAQRAEELFASFAGDGQEAARQLFLRLVTLGEGVEDTRRRVALSEVATLQTSEVLETSEVLNGVVEKYGRYRLLTFDHDPITRKPTVEVAHEALLREWPRLRRWLSQNRDDVRLQRQLASFAAEWAANNHEYGFILRGSRLDLFTGWAATMDLALTPDEQAFLDASVTARKQREIAEQARQQRELETAQQLAATERQRAEEQTQAAQGLRRRAYYLVGALAIALLLAVVAVLASRQSSLNAETAQANANLAATSEANAVTEADQRGTAQAVAAEERDAAVSAEATAVAAGILADEQRDVALAAEAESEAQRIIAEQERDLTRSRELALAAISALEKDPELSIRLALEGLNVAYTQDAEDVLHQAIQASHVQQNLFGHEGETGQLAFTPDGTKLVSTAYGGTARVWDVATGIELLTFDKHEGRVITVVIDPSGEWAITGGQDGNARRWDLTTGEELMVFPDLLMPNFIQGEIALSPNGELLATPSQNNTVKIWDALTGENLQTFTAPGAVEYVEFSPDGQILSIGSRHFDYVVLLDATTGVELLSIPGQDGGWGVSFSPDNELLKTTTASEDEIVIWDLEASLNSGLPQEEIRIQISGLDKGVFSPDGKWLIIENIIYDVESGEIAHKLASEDIMYWSIFSPDGLSVAYGGGDGVIHISNIAPFGNPEFPLLEHEGRVFRIATNLDGSLLVTGDFESGVAHLWDLNTGKQIVSEVAQQEDGISTVAISADGSKIATGSPWTPEVKVWDASGSKALITLEHGPPSTDWQIRTGIIDVAFNPADDRYLATAGADGTARIWEWETGELIHLFEPHPEKTAVIIAEFSPDGSLLATATTGPNPLIKIWDTNSGKELLAITDLLDRPWNLRFSPDGQFFAAGGSFGWLTSWDAKTGEQLIQFYGHNATLIGLDFTANGDRLISAGYDNTVRIWDPTTGAELSQLSLSYPVNSVLFLDDKSHIVTSSNADTNVRFYTLNLEELVAIAQSKVTRPFTLAECAQYRIESCADE